MNANGYVGVKLEPSESQSKQERFLNSIKDPDPDSLREILLEGGDDFDVNHIYEHGKNRREYNALQILCSDIIDLREKKESEEKFRKLKPRYVKCAELLLSHNVDVTYRDPDNRLQAIDLAVLTGAVEIVRMVLNRLKDLGMSIANIDLIDTVVLFFEDETEFEEEYLDVIELLIDSGVDINTLDFDVGTPPIYSAALLKFERVVQLIISKREFDVDLDFYVDEKGKTARTLINKYNLYDGRLPNKNANARHALYRHLHERNVNEFIESYKLRRDEMSNDNKCSFLIRSVLLGVEEILEYLLNEIERRYYDRVILFELAYRKGYFKVLEVLLEATSDTPYDIRNVRDLIRTSAFAKTVADELVDHDKCLSMLLAKNGNIDLNEEDKFGKTLLEIAIGCKKFSMMSILLSHGASLVRVDRRANLSDRLKCFVKEIHPKTIEKHFDACIVTTDDASKSQKKKKKSTKVESENDYTVEFASVLPPRRADAENAMQFLPEMTVLRCIAADPEYSGLLRHPFATIFVSLKWSRIRHFFYVDVLLYTIYTVVLNTYIFVPMIYLYLSLFFVFVVANVWEVIQVFIFGLSYFTNLDSWLKWIVSWLTACVLVMYHFGDGGDVTVSITTQLYAIDSLVSMVNFFVLIGHFSSLSTSVIMIKTIYRTFLKSCLTYSVLIVAFSTSFYILLKDEYSDFFGNYGLAFFKTILMSTGEYDSNNLRLDRYPVVSYVITVFFVTLISISLINLLTGLAISDIHNIKANAELYGQITKIEQIGRMETIFLKRIFLVKFSFLKKICLFSVIDGDTSVGIDATKSCANVSAEPTPIDDTILNELKRIMRTRSAN